METVAIGMKIPRHGPLPVQEIHVIVFCDEKKRLINQFSSVDLQAMAF